MADLKDMLLFQDAPATNYNNLRSNLKQLLETQAQKIPDKICLIFGNEKLTYRDVHEKANQLAHFLVKQNIQKQSLIPICIERSIDMIIGILAIIKAGCAFVPIDPEYPLDRILFIIEDTKAPIVLTDKKSKEKISDHRKTDIIEIDFLNPAINIQPTYNLRLEIKPYDLAYVIYTSGSTGLPKGVMIEHHSLLNYLLNKKLNYISSDPGTSATFMHVSFCFDASLAGIFMPLINGKLIVISSMKGLDAFEDKNFILYSPYDFINLTPSQLFLFGYSIRTYHKRVITNKLIVGGEALRINHLDYLINENIDIEIINEYGPTEATVACTVFSFKSASDINEVKKYKTIPIGKPLESVQIHLIDQEGKRCPIGEAGEIVIGGEGVGRGYANKDQLTYEKFLIDKSNPEIRYYKTGDIGRWLEDGNLEYIGRRDDQVNIHGFRVELGEIEMVLQNSGMVKNAVAVAREFKDLFQLICYVILKDGSNKNDCKVFLENKLPDYMIPDEFVEMDEFPLTLNGKINKKALPNP